jgi:beta-lactamase superfamily II metal-dependent hydrolase
MPPVRPLAAALVAAALCLALAIPASAVTPNGRLLIVHLDVGQGDGSVVISPLGQVVMIDDGVGGNPTPASGVKVPAQLQALGITHVDHHFASHYHADHIGLFKTIFGAGGVATLGYGWDRGGSYTTSYYTDYVSTVGSKRRTLTKGQVITLDSLSAHPVTIRCVDLNGAGRSTTDENSLCVQLKVSYGEFDMSFGGDTPGQNSGSYVNVETTVGPEMGSIEAYKVHHHGSATSSQTDWLNATHPTVAVVSAGNGNSYGHPTSAAMTRLHNAGTHVYWTETGSGAAPVAGWDKVSNDQVIISATWEPGGVDTVRGKGFADTFANSGTPAGDTTPPAVTVSAPDGGEDWKAGSAHAITWTATDAVGVTSVDLAYSTDGGSTYPNVIAAGMANTGSYSWTVPNTPTGSARVRVTARDAAGNTAADGSNANFAIGTWTITASSGAGGSISPSGSVAVSQGGSQAFAIGPDAGYGVADVLVDGASVGAVTNFSFANVAANHTINASFAIGTHSLTVSVVGQGSVSKIPDQPSYPHGTTVQTNASPASGWAFAGWTGDLTATTNPLSLSMVQDLNISAVFVDVAAPTVQVTAPNGGESLTAGVDYTISWTAEDNVAVDSVQVERSLSGPGGPWVVLAYRLPNSGSLGWTAPDEASDDALVRVIAFDHALNAGGDTSDSPFHIVIPIVAVGGNGAAILSLARPVPNPSSSEALFRFSLPEVGTARLEMVDVSGRRVWGVEGVFPAGTNSWQWGRPDAHDGQAKAGLYFVRLVTPWGTRTERFVLLK